MTEFFSRIPYMLRVIGVIVGAGIWTIFNPFSLGFGDSILLLLLEVFVIVWTGSKHAFLYNYQVKATPTSSWIYTWCDLHFTQYYGEYLLFTLLLLAGVPPLSVLGAQAVARLPFQGLINLSVNRPFIDPNEVELWYLRDKPIRKVLSGHRSILKAIFGLVLVVAGFLLS